MTDREAAPAKNQPRSRKLYVLWGICISTLVALALFCWLVVVPYARFRSAVGKLERGTLGSSSDVVEDLGGPSEALRCARAYLAMPEMIASRRYTAALVLADCGEAALPVVAKYLSDGDEAVRAAAMQALGELAKTSGEALKALAATLGDRTFAPDVRSDAAYLLGTMSGKWQVAVPALVGALEDQDSGVRMHAAASLGGFGSDAKSAVPSLVKLLSDEDKYSRITAADTLGRIGPEAGNAAPTLVTLLGHKDEDTRERAAWALGIVSINGSTSVTRGDGGEEILITRDIVRGQPKVVLTEAAKVAGPALARALLSDSPKVRKTALASLCLMAQDATAAIPELEKLARHKSATIRLAAAKALKKIGTR